MTDLPENVDILVIGSGMAGSHFALEMASQGRKVTVLEAGPRRTRGEWVTNFTRSTTKGPQAPYPSEPYAPHPEDNGYGTFYDQANPNLEFVGAYLRIYGGTTWHWTGFADRLRPADFRMQSEYGVGFDWPVDYDELEPFYEHIEPIWGVAGTTEYVWGAPRKTDYPLPPIPATYMDSQLNEALAANGLSAGIFSHARNSIQFDNRPACCGNNTCVPVCPIGAKLDGSVIADKAEAAGAEFFTEALVTHLAVGDDGQITHVMVRRPDGSMHQITANTFVVACHAIENPRLLLNSAQENAPNGVANGSDTVGRYLITQANQDTQGLTPDPVYPYRGPQQTSGLLQYRDGPFRSDYAANGTSFMNSGWSGNNDATKLAKTLIGQGKMGQELANEINAQVAHHLRLNSSAEILGDPNNRLTLSDEKDSAGIPKSKVSVTMDDYTLEGMKVALDVNLKIFASLGATNVTHDDVYLSNAIIGGTTRMGTDENTSVVDPYLRSHQHKNLFILGSSTHLSMPVNAPTLTVSAMAVRTARHILAG